MRRTFAITGTILLLCGIARANDAATQPTSQPAVMDLTDNAAMKDAEGKNIVIEGKVVEANWSSSGKVMWATFSDDRDGLELVIFSSHKETMDKAFGGDVATALEGAKVRVKGTIKLYHGRPEMIVDKPSQLTILSATTQP
jgi:DNA/RNA endonuclease YhcR with UshA esterase domain